MNRRDVLALEAFYAAAMRREAKARANTNSAAAEQLNRFDEASERRVEAIKCGPLFDREAS